MNREFIKAVQLTILSMLLVMSGACTPVSQQSERPPNVIIIYTDDQGSIDVHAYGAEDLYTPNMDHLAKTGVRFTQFYAAAPVCSPSRAALLTGKTPLAAGLPGNAPSKMGLEGLPSAQVTIAEILKENGYATGHVGKWHLGYTPQTMPNGQGFDYSYGHMGGCIDNYSHFFYWNGPNRHDLWENGKEIWADGAYFQDLMAEKVDLFLEEHQDTTFFLYYAINMPHYPLQGTAKWRDHYRDMESPRSKYAACVSTVDERIGQLLTTLESLDLRENTIVIFQSDHGHSMEERTFGGGGNAGIYRGAKFSLFEGGIRIPAMISWPGHIPENEVRDQMCVNVDWLPTVLDLCDASYDTDAFEGKSMQPVIMNDEPSAHEVFCWYTNKERWAVRKGEWKLLKNPIDPSNKATITEKDSLFLTNIKTHPEELENLAGQFPGKVTELMQAYTEWYDRVN